MDSVSSLPEREIREFSTHVDHTGSKEEEEEEVGDIMGCRPPDDGEDENDEDEERRTVCSKVLVLDDVKLVKDRQFKKPPRPPRSLKPFSSLDAADQQLIKEISQLIMMKRARVERMKKTLKIKPAKSSSVNGNLFAMLCTIIFCLLFIFQGASSGKRVETSMANFQSSQVVISGRKSLPKYQTQG